MENDQADAVPDGRTYLARPNSQARTGTRKNNFSCSADHEQNWQPCPVDHTLLKVLTLDTYIHTSPQKESGEILCDFLPV